MHTQGDVLPTPINSESPKVYIRMPPLKRKILDSKGDFRYVFSDKLIVRIIRTEGDKRIWRIFVESPMKRLLPKTFKQLSQAIDYLCFEYQT